MALIRKTPRHDSSLALAVELLAASQRTFALTGAGISTPSGIPDFRSASSGLWNNVDPLEVASIWGFHDHPERFYNWFRVLLARTAAAKPNGAHKALASMEAAGRLVGVVTQNIDSLHQAAGSRCVCEVHGHLRTMTCLGCNAQSPADGPLADVLAGLPPPRCPSCGELLKPDVVLFGEPPPYEVLSRAQEEALACDAMLIVGTSLEVMPAADLPLLAKRRGAKLVLVNLTPTQLDAQMDVIVRADVVQALNLLLAGLDIT
ncbi:MAG: SIR2 family NAD-dependent protein deacylase [Nitrososphaerales archaeon]